MQNQVIDRRVEEILSGMTVEDKVGQLFIVRRPQDDVNLNTDNRSQSFTNVITA